MLVRTELVRTDPFRELDRLAEWVFSTPTRPAALRMDAYRKDDWFYVDFDIPGIAPEDIDVTVERNVLTVRAERRDPDDQGVQVIASERPRGTFTRQVFLSDTLDTDKLEADYENGVLRVRIPVREAAKPRRISIGTRNERHELTR